MKDHVVLAEFSGWVYTICRYCSQRVYGTQSDIDSGLRKHFDYCDEKPDDDMMYQLDCGHKGSCNGWPPAKPRCKQHGDAGVYSAVIAFECRDDKRQDNRYDER